MRFNKKDRTEIIENALSWIVVFGMLAYGAGKWVQFEGAAQLDKTINELTPMQLMWAFYGYSKAFALTIGAFEIMGGALIFIKRTRLLGCLFTSTILINIILQDIFFEVHRGALKTALFYQLLIMIVLWMNRGQLLESLRHLLLETNRDQNRKKLLFKILIAFLLFVVLRVFEYFIAVA